jgi:ADP-ribose pyrophosphatase YjhB (NUDIX family)
MSSGSRALIGLLSEPARLRVVGALALGAGTAAEVVRATGLDPREVAAALRRLESGGLVTTERARLRLHEERFKERARAEAPPPPADAELSTDTQTAAVLRIFAPDGRIIGLPVSRGKRRLLLGHVVRVFEPGVRYPERDVNALLRIWHDDHAMLRRLLYDEGFLDRKDAVYWRIGGWVDTSPPEPPAPPEPPTPEPPTPEPVRYTRLAVHGLALRDGQILLTRISRGEMRGRWHLPGGGSDFGERPVDTLTREAYEETGLNVRIDELLDVDAVVVDHERGEIEHALLVLYRITPVGGTLGVTEVGGSTDQVAWVRLSDLDPAAMTPTAARAVERFSGR